MDGPFADTIARKVQQAQRAAVPSLTRRDVRLPRVAGRAVAVIGMRRAGKSSFLWQLLGDRAAAGTPREGLLYFNFEDERLAGMQATDLALLHASLRKSLPCGKPQALRQRASVATA